ncbi:hypothetical protein [Endozoicomonas sp. ALC066]|uniref:hypothetical protein n=1 Tax=Endozoicomonas sp. ALC066 TaxID=3403078 RepID=UPI003BB645BE
MNTEFEHLSEIDLGVLCHEIISDALLLAVGDPFKPGRKGKLNADLCREAWQWIEEDDFESPFSFINCCKNLDIDSFDLRQEIRTKWRSNLSDKDGRYIYDNLFVDPHTDAELITRLFKKSEAPILVDPTEIRFKANENQYQVMLRL